MCLCARGRPTDPTKTKRQADNDRQTGRRKDGHAHAITHAPVLGGEEARLDRVEVLLHRVQHAVHRRVEVQVAVYANCIICCGCMRELGEDAKPLGGESRSSRTRRFSHSSPPAPPPRIDPPTTHLVILPTGPASLMGGRCSGEGSTLIRSKIFCVLPSPRSSVWATCGGGGLRW